MPIYEFRCKACGTVFEVIRPMGDSGKTLSCPECGNAAPERIYSTFAAQTGAQCDDTATACGGRPFA